MSVDWCRRLSEEWDSRLSPHWQIQRMDRIVPEFVPTEASCSATPLIGNYIVSNLALLRVGLLRKTLTSDAENVPPYQDSADIES